MDSTSTSPWLWAVFAGIVAGMMALDLLVFQREARAVSRREAAAWTAGWVGLALGFNALVWAWRGPDRGLEFLTGYLIEESLSLDNLFVFLVIFRYFSLPPHQYRIVLTWGILGAIILRGVMIVCGVALVSWFAWTLELFGLLLVVTATRLFYEEETKVEPEHNLLVRVARLVYPVAHRGTGDRFFVRGARGRGHAMTPLFIALLVICTTDVVFATDSIPAIFAVTRDPFVVFTSNMFAVMGLRSVFFLLADLLHVFRFLRQGLALVLGFIGAKMLLDHWVHASILVSLGGVALILAGSVAASLAFREPVRQRRRT
jgi:tellurite resistance protein TerC